MKRNLITSALPYANGYIHLGHVSGAYLTADLYARFLRLCGQSTLFICGSDEHGVAITIAAEKEGVSPQTIIDRYHSSNLKAFHDFGISFDHYSRTSLPIHHEVAQDWFKHFVEKGVLATKEEDQFFDEKANMFLPDRYVEGVCPNCSKSGARGDQCDSCGAYYDQLELKEPKSLVTGNTPIVRKTTHWYFPLGQFQSQLEEYIESHRSDWKENVLQQCRSWLKQGLNDRAITRDLNWGVKVPLEEGMGKVLYVWFDAVLGYISATKEWSIQQGTPDAWKDWWLRDDEHEGSEYSAFIGKDNIVFHALMFPAMLLGRGSYIVPKNVPANEFLNLEGQKFSKSRNWAIDLKDALTDFAGGSNVDALRYALAMNFPETRDSDFTWKDFQARTNNELASIFGNFVNRTLQFVQKNFENKVPTLPNKYSELDKEWSLLWEEFNRSGSGQPTELFRSIGSSHHDYFDEHDILLLAEFYVGVKTIEDCYRQYRFRDALTATMNLARASNKYFNDSAPWKTIKTDSGECAKTLYICVQAIHSLTIAFAPIIPNTSSTIRKILNCEETELGIPNGGVPAGNVWNLIGLPLLRQGSELSQPTILFQRIEDEEIEAQLRKLGRGIESAPILSSNETTEDNLISIDDFKKVQLRVAQILEAERVPKSEKLIKLQISLGESNRQIVAGIGQFYQPEELIGKKIVVVGNLKPAKLMGLESNGMLLAANFGSGLRVIFVDESVLLNAEVR